MISIVIPLYNKETYILQTVQMVLQQTFSDFELLIVDDGSTDQSIQKISGIVDHRIKIVSKKNGGVSSARNCGIKNAKYDYIAFLDADDTWNDVYLETMAMLIKDFPDAEVFASNFEFVYSNSRKPATKDISRGYIDNYFKYASKADIIHSSSVIVKKSGFEKAGLFDTRMSRGEDMDLWARLATQCIIAYSDKINSTYVIGNENSSISSITEPSKIFAYYISLNNCVNYYHFRFLKMILIRRIVRYVVVDKRLDYSFQLFMKNRRNIFRTYGGYKFF